MPSEASTRRVHGARNTATAWEGNGRARLKSAPSHVEHGCQRRPGTEFPQCAGDLWLISNIPALEARPYRIVLGDGIAYRNIRRLPEPEKNCPLIGMRALEESGLRILFDYPNKSVSVWTPGPWYESLWIWLRRVISGFRTRSMPWSRGD